MPPHKSGAYAGTAAAAGVYPLAEELAATVLSLPMGPHMTEDDQAVVIDAIRSWAAGVTLSVALTPTHRIASARPAV